MNAKILIALIVTVVVALLGWGVHVLVVVPTVARGEIEKSLEMQIKADSRAARMHLETARKIAPEMAEVHIAMGNLNSHEGNIQDALANYNRAIELDSRQSDAYYGRGYCQLELRNFQAALDDCDKALANGISNQAAAHANKAQAYYYLNRLEESLAEYNLALKQNSDCQFRLARAQLLLKMSRRKEALEDIEQLVSSSQLLDRAYYLRGNIKAASLDTRGAIADYDLVLRENPKFWIVRVDRAWSNRLLGNKEKVEADLERVLKARSTNDFEELMRSYAFILSGNRDKARDSLGSIRKRNSDDAEAWYATAILESAEHNPKAVIENCDRTIALEPHAMAYQSKIQAMLCEEDFKGAAQTSRAALDRVGWKSTVSVDYVLLGAYARRRLGEPNTANSLLEEGLKKCDSELWAYKVLSCFAGKSSFQDLAKESDDSVKRFCLEFYWALDLISKNDYSRAKEHLLWVKEKMPDLLLEWFLAERLLKS